MAKDRRTRLLGLLVVSIAVSSYLAATCGNGRELARVEAQSARLTTERDSLEQVARRLELTQTRLRRQVETQAQHAQALRDSVVALERLRQESQLSVRLLRKTPELAARLQATFPEIAATRWGVTTIAVDDGDKAQGADTLGLEVFLVPLWFTETFIIDHQNAMSWREQKDRLLAVDSLGTQVVALQDSITRLEEEKSQAFQAGYAHAFATYSQVSRRYVAELRKPRLSLGSTLGICLGAAAAGFLAGVVSQ